MFGVSGGARAGLRLILIDFLLAFALIWGTVFTVAFARSRAHAAGAPGLGAVVGAIAGREGGLSAGVTAPGAPVPQPRSYTGGPVGATAVATYLLLSLSVAALAALDLAFWRHLRHAYSSPERAA
jgi:hypothetical protein